MQTVYWSEKISEGKPWYKGSKRYWVDFSSEVGKEFANHKYYKNYVIYLFRRTYTFGIETFQEYEFEYYLYSESGVVEVDRQYIKKMIGYKNEFEGLLK